MKIQHKILIIEDNQSKKENIINFLNNYNFNIVVKESYNSGLRDIITNEYDLILLDMNLPVYDNENEFMEFAGEKILSNIHLRSINTKVIIISENDFNSDTYSDILIGCVKYSIFNNDWQTHLNNLINTTIDLDKDIVDMVNKNFWDLI